MTTASLTHPELSHGEAVTAAQAAVGRWRVKAAATLRAWWCAANGGHHRLLHAEANRLTLKCVACGHSTPGWESGGARLVPRYAGDPERHRLRPGR